MNAGWNILYVFIGILFAILAGITGYIVCSPMPVVRLLRKKTGEEPELPQEYEVMKQHVEVRKNLCYPSQYAQNTYDLFLPKTGERHPLILWIHGGAFVAGDKEGINNWGTILAAKGYAVAAVNYSWAPENRYPAQIRQVADAFREIVRIAESGSDQKKAAAVGGSGQNRIGGRIDVCRVAVAGDSAGAYLAIQFALCHTNSNLAERLGVTSPLKDNALKCAFLYCGPYDITQMSDVRKKMLKFLMKRISWSFLGRKNWKKAPLSDTITPMDYVTETSVPCYITDGNSFSFESHGKALGKALREKGIPVRERYFDQTEYGVVNHEYQMMLDCGNAELCLNDTLEFAKRYLGECEV